MKVYVLCFLAFSICLLSSFLLKTDIFPNNDLAGNVIPLLYFKDSISSFQFPMWNPYVQQGIPVVSDPLYGIYNPAITLPLLFLPITIATKITYVVSVMLACVSMFLLLRFFKISELFSVLISLTYAGCSYLPGRIHAGHLEKIVSYGLIPLFFLCFFKTVREKNIMWAGLTALSITLILFSGDIYGAMYACFCLLTGCILYIWKDRRVFVCILISVLLFIAFSSVKLLPILELQGYIEKIREPFRGSQNLISVLYYLFFPFSFLLNRVFPIKSFLSQSYGWWESICFIGPFSIIGVFYIGKQLKKSKDSILLLLAMIFILLLLLSMPAFPLNPIHVLIRNIQLLAFFHVPSRVFIFMTIPVLIGFGLFLTTTRYKKFAFFIVILNFLYVAGYSHYIFVTKEFQGVSGQYRRDITKNVKNQDYFLKNKNLGEIPYVYAYENKTFPIRSNYGLHLKNALNTDRIMPLGEFKGQAQPISIGVNMFSITLDTSKSGVFTVYQSNYPGFTGYIDGEKQKLVPGKFLHLKTIPGKHVYEFRFFSLSFLLGCVISIFSISMWLVVIVRKKHFHFPNLLH